VVNDSDPLFESVRRANWAKEKIVDFHNSVNAWSATQPYAHFTELNKDTEFTEHKLKLVKTLPFGVTERCGDAIQAVRSALDLLMSDLARALGKGTSGIAFPFGNDANEFEAEMEKRKIHRKLGQPAVDILRRLQPYDGGDDLLFSINKLNNTHKHRENLKATASVVFAGTRFESIGTGYVEMPNEGWKNDEMVLVRAIGDEKVQLKLQIIPQVFFEGIKTDKGEFALVVLLKMIKRVAEIIADFRGAYFPG
jgi:hypothetical protein